MVQTVATRHPSIRFWTRPNQGAHSTINEGIREARGRYLAILNSDDLYHAERLQRCLGVLEADPGAAVVATRISFIDEHDHAIENHWYEEAWAFHEKVGDLGLALMNGNFLLTTSNIVARRAVFDEVGSFDDLRYAHDLDFFLRLLAQGKALTLLPQPLLTYRVHGGNTVSEDPLQLQFETAVIAGLFARQLGSAKGGSAHGPQYFSQLLQVTERNQRALLVALALLYAQREEAGMLSPGACLADPAFLSALREIQALEAAQGGRAREIEELRTTVADRDAEVGRLVRELEEMRKQLTYMLDSLSWRFTSPLRAIRERFRPDHR